MTQPGHHRPLGTVAKMRFPVWNQERAPELGDVISQTDGPDGDPDEVRRAYRVVGYEETATGYRIFAERVEYGTLPESLDPDAIWHFHNLPRRAADPFAH